MKQVFKCDYCSQIGTEEEIKRHELECTENHNKKSCHTCAYKSIAIKDNVWVCKCKAGKDVPEGKIFEFCETYKRRDKTGDLFNDLIGDLFHMVK